ncbi:hypothetical protein ACFQV2_17280 [Actinokineospora soli]|uniref:Neocarzinostatin family protein n=1 Tax=Actinokineospora soli TaxID=1048753 RepID=A0ABW2TP50_9PSEU
MLGTLLTAGLLAPSAHAAPVTAPTVAVESGKLVHGGKAVKVTGTYSCGGGTADLHLDLDQSAAKGKGKSKGLRCEGDHEVKKFTAVVSADAVRTWFVSGSAWLSLRLCASGTVTVLASLNVAIFLRL